MNPEYKISKNGMVTVCLLKSQGKTFRGVAKSSDIAEHSREVGMQIAYYRAELQAREFAILRTRNVINDLKYRHENYAEKWSSKLYDRFIQEAYEVLKSQLSHRNHLRDVLKELTK